MPEPSPFESTAQAITPFSILWSEVHHTTQKIQRKKWAPTGDGDGWCADHGKVRGVLEEANGAGVVE
jgi:hypothetical protein